MENYKYDTQLLLEGRNLDEDEMVLFLQRRNDACPYFSFSDDYKLAGRQ